METTNNNQKPKMFKVYFEIFETKRYVEIEERETITSQEEAENYVKNIWVPSKIKFFNIKTKSSIDWDGFSKTMDDVFEKFDKTMNNVFGNVDKTMDKAFNKFDEIFDKLNTKSDTKDKEKTDSEKK